MIRPLSNFLIFRFPLILSSWNLYSHQTVQKEWLITSEGSLKIVSEMGIHVFIHRLRSSSYSVRRMQWPPTQASAWILGLFYLPCPYKADTCDISQHLCVCANIYKFYYYTPWNIHEMAETAKVWIVLFIT